MKRISKIFSVVFCLILLAGLGAQLSAASAPYETYTYSINGLVLTSPHAYTPSASITSYEMNLSTALNAPRDIFVDENGKIYISDTGNNRVVVCNSSFVAEFEISEFINENGVHDALSSPRGLFVNEDTIYVCDWQNSRIVLFDLEGNFKEIIEAPTADVMGSDTLFRPTAVAVSESGMIYVVSSTTYSGIIALNPDGSFQSFLGAQQTSVSLAVRIRRMLFPNVVTQSYISTPYQNLTIDDEGLIWATIIFGEDEIPMLENAILGGATNSIYAPVKQLNPRGDDIMIRNGFFMPAGEINFNSTEFQNTSSAYGSVFGPSSLVDIALGPNGMWSVIDSKRSKIYTYDSEGNLLFAFGDQGRQLGNLASPTAITYAGSKDQWSGWGGTYAALYNMMNSNAACGTAEDIIQKNHINHTVQLKYPSLTGMIADGDKQASGNIFYTNSHINWNLSSAVLPGLHSGNLNVTYADGHCDNWKYIHAVESTTYNTNPDWSTARRQ